MSSGRLQSATERLRLLLKSKVPDLLLQAECGGDLELPSPPPWGFAHVPTLYELADMAERELYNMRRQAELRNQRGRNQYQLTPSTSQPPLEAEQRHDESPPRRGDEDQQGEGPRLHAQNTPPPPAALRAAQPQQQKPCDPRAPAQRVPAHADDAQPGECTTPSEKPVGGAAAAVSTARRSEGPAGPPAAADTDADKRHAFGDRDGVDAAGGGERRAEDVCAATISEEGVGPPVGEIEGAEAGGGTGGGHRDDRSSLESETVVTEAGAAVGSAGGDHRGSGVVLEPGSTANAVAQPTVYSCTAFLVSLEQSRTFRSPQCEAAMVEAMGMMQLYDGLAGSTLGPPPEKEGLEALRSLLKQHIDARWALEAVKQGVAAAKQGNYADAFKAYARALELDSHSAEAYVARGAAHANQRAFDEAERDLLHALSLDPGHRNAATYLEAVRRHVDAQQQQLEELERERQQALAQQRNHPRPLGRGPGGALGPLTPTAPMGAGAGRAAGAGLREGGLQGRVGTASEPPPDEKRRRWSDVGGSSSSGTASSLSGSSGSDSPGRGGPASIRKPASDDIKRALEVVMKARKSKRKSKHKKHKKKRKKSKKNKRD